METEKKQNKISCTPKDTETYAEQYEFIYTHIEILSFLSADISEFGPCSRGVISLTSKVEKKRLIQSDFNQTCHKFILTEVFMTP